MTQVPPEKLVPGNSLITATPEEGRALAITLARHSIHAMQHEEEVAGMDLATITDGADRFVAYVEELTSVIGHADRALPLRDYCAGLFRPCRDRALLDDALVIAVQREAAGVVDARAFETAGLDFERVVTAVPVLIDPFAE